MTIYKVISIEIIKRKNDPPQLSRTILRDIFAQIPSTDTRDGLEKKKKKTKWRNKFNLM